jgi:hypothetical protein
MATMLAHLVLAHAGTDPAGAVIYPWLVFTHQRSGSRWFVDSMLHKTGGLTRSGPELTCDGHEQREREPICPCHRLYNESAMILQARICSRYLTSHFDRQAHDGIGKPTPEKGTEDSTAVLQTVHPGFKFMAKYGDKRPRGGEFEVLARAVCSLNVSFIFMWRKNTLRRIVSGKANDEDGDHPVNEEGHIAHPKSEEQAAALRTIKPKLEVETLLQKIELENAWMEAMVRDFEKYGGATCASGGRGRRYYYEDLVERNEGSAGRWGEILRILNVWTGHSDLAVIRGEQPLLDTVDNPAGVVEALNGTKWAWMLYD